MSQMKKKAWLHYLGCLCIVIFLFFMGSMPAFIINAEETNDNFLEEIQEIVFTEEQFAKVQYYQKPNIQAKAITKNRYDSTYAFSLLSEEEKAVYKELEMASAEFQNSTQDAQEIDGDNVAVGIELEIGELEKDRIASVVVGFIYDHPQYFWTKGYSYWVGNESDDVRKIVLQCDENYLDGEKRYLLWQQMQQNIEIYLDGVVSLKDDYSKELTLHDMLAKQLSYAYGSSGIAETSKWAHNIEGAFSEEYHKVVCEGYAKAFQLLLNAAGIENIYIVGNGKVGTAWQGHAWNQVKIEKQWYLVDLTWDDGAVISRKYFNLNQQTFSSNHTAYHQSSNQVARWCYELEDAEGNSYSYQQQGEIKEDKSYYQLTYEIPEQFDFIVYNNGVEVSNGSLIEAGTRLQFVLAPKEDVLFDGILTADKNAWKFNEYRYPYENSFLMPEKDMKLEMTCSAYMSIKDILNYVKVSKSISVKIGKAKTITVKKPKQLRKYTITYYSNHSQIASVTNAGKIKGKKVGNAAIIVKIVDAYQNKKIYKVKVKVKKYE